MPYVDWSDVEKYFSAGTSGGEVFIPETTCAGTALSYPPQSQTPRTITVNTVWRCPYCQQNNPPERLDCRCCGAPKL